MNRTVYVSEAHPLYVLSYDDFQETYDVLDTVSGSYSTIPANMVMLSGEQQPEQLIHTTIDALVRCTATLH
jgi:hypothetical protein